MKKLFLITLLFFLCTSPIFAEGFYKLPKGLTFKAYSRVNIDTSLYETGDTVSFINPNDLWVEEKKIIPENSLFIGEIEDLKMPIRGVNAALVIKITQIKTPDKRIIPIEAHVVQKGKTLLGGDLTPPLSYNKMPHKSVGYKSGYLQYVPSGEYSFGEHLKITAGGEVQIQLEEDLIIDK